MIHQHMDATLEVVVLPLTMLSKSWHRKAHQLQNPDSAMGTMCTDWHVGLPSRLCHKGVECDRDMVVAESLTTIIEEKEHYTLCIKPIMSPCPQTRRGCRIAIHVSLHGLCGIHFLSSQACTNKTGHSHHLFQECSPTRASSTL